MNLTSISFFEGTVLSVCMHRFLTALLLIANCKILSTFLAKKNIKYLACTIFVAGGN